MEVSYERLVAFQRAVEQCLDFAAAIINLARQISNFVDLWCFLLSSPEGYSVVLGVSQFF